MIKKHKNRKVYLDPNTMKPHRLDGPAVIYDHGSEEWWVNGLRHRIDGPAVTKIHDYKIQKEWWIAGKLHRLGGPAIEIVPANKRLNFYYKPKYFDIKDKSIDYLCFGKIEEWWEDGIRFRENLPSIVSDNGFEVWTKNGKAHRDNDYAIKLSNGGGQIWCSKGVIHRDNGPAVIFQNRNAWFRKNKLHRDEGPAEIIHSSYSRILRWHFNGIEKKEFTYFSDGSINAIFKSESGYMYSPDGPALIRSNTVAWYEYPGVQCRKNGPCLIMSNHSNGLFNAGSLSTYYCYDEKHKRSSSFETFLSELSDDKKVDILFNIHSISNALEYAEEIYNFYKNLIERSVKENPLTPVS